MTGIAETPGSAIQEMAPSVVTRRILAALGSRRFLRAPLELSAELEACIGDCVLRKESLPVLLLWGKGPKLDPDRAEQSARNLLAGYARRVASVWSPGIRYSILLADTHAVGNGYSLWEIEHYFGAVRDLLSPLGAEFDLLSRIWKEAELDWDQVHQWTKRIDELAWRHVVDRLDLVASAARHCRFDNPERSALVYFAMRTLENRVLPRFFPGFLYATSESPARCVLFPDMRVLHMYSMARGRTAKPWFTVMPFDRYSPPASKEEKPCAA